MGSIALKMLLADRGKLLAALVGVIFSVMLVNIQGGLFLGLILKASLLVDAGEADIWIGHRDIRNVDFPCDVRREVVHRVRSLPGVARAEPYLVGHSVMTLPNGGFEPVLVIGCDPDSLLGNTWNIVAGNAAAIRQPHGVIVDVCDGEKIGHPRIGDVREIAGRKARVVAQCHGVLGFLVTPYVFTTIDRAAEYLGKPVDMCSYVLVQATPGASVAAVQAAIRQRLPEFDVYTKQEYARLSIAYWLQRTGIGISFGGATALGLIVGLVIVAQTLYASVLDRLPEFAALKAIGARDWQIFGLLSTQALVMAVAGAAIALVLVIGCHAAFSTPRASMVIPWWLSLGSAALVTVICLGASLVPYLRIRRLDPAIVLYD